MFKLTSLKFLTFLASEQYSLILNFELYIHSSFSVCNLLLLYTRFLIVPKIKESNTEVSMEQYGQRNAPLMIINIIYEVATISRCVIMRVKPVPIISEW